MGPITSIAVFLTIWWTVLFTVLPLGNRTHHEEGIPVPGGGEPGSPVMGSSFKSLPRSLAMMNAPEWVCDIKVGDTSDGFSVCCIGDASLLTAGCPACQRAPTARVRQSNGAAPSSTR